MGIIATQLDDSEWKKKAKDPNDEFSSLSGERRALAMLLGDRNEARFERFGLLNQFK